MFLTAAEKFSLFPGCHNQFGLNILSGGGLFVDYSPGKKTRREKKNRRKRSL